MKSFIQFSEAFDSSYKFTGKKVAKDEYSYGFDSEFTGKDGKTERSRLDVDIVGSENADDDEHYMWDLGFSRRSKKVLTKFGKEYTTLGKASYDVTGGGDALKIFSTVMKICDDFIKKEDPKYVSFGAEKPKGSDSKTLASREKLYLRMSKKFFGKKFKIIVKSTAQQSVFYLEKR